MPSTFNPNNNILQLIGDPTEEQIRPETTLQFTLSRTLQDIYDPLIQDLPKNIDRHLASTNNNNNNNNNINNNNNNNRSFKSNSSNNKNQE